MRRGARRDARRFGHAEAVGLVAAGRGIANRVLGCSALLARLAETKRLPLSDRRSGHRIPLVRR